MNNKTKINILITCLLLIVLNVIIFNKIYKQKEGFNVKKLKSGISKKFKSIGKNLTKFGKSIAKLFIYVILIPLLFFLANIIITVFIPFCMTLMLSVFSFLFVPIPVNSKSK